MALQIRHVVDVVAVVKESGYDRFLVILALLAPLALLTLSKWQASLDTWYAPMDVADANYFGESFQRSVAKWLESAEGAGAALVVIADRKCPCTRATLKKLDEALALSPRRDIRLVVRDIGDVDADQDAVWTQVLSEVPATPTLLVVEGKRLLYAGPVTSGNFCTTAVGRVLGVTALQLPRSAAMFNLIDKGCYCRLQDAPA